jgi:hypothetical protein
MADGDVDLVAPKIQQARGGDKLQLDVAMRTFKGAELKDQPCHGERGGQRQPHDLSAMTARIASVASSMRRIAGSISSR